MLPRGCPRAVALPCWAATQILQRARRPTWDDMSIGKMTESDVPGAQGSPAPFVKTQGAGPECVTPGSRLQQERSEGGDGERTQVTSEGRKGQDCGVWSSGAGREQGSRGAGCRPGKGRSDGTLPLPLPAWLLLGNGPLGTGQWAVTSGQWVTLANVGKCKWVRVQVVSECGQRAFTDALHPSTLPHPPPLPLPRPPSNPSTGLIKALALRDRPLPACPFDLLAPSVAVESRRPNHYTTRGKLLDGPQNNCHPSNLARPRPRSRPRPHRRVPLQIKRQQTKFLFPSFTAPTAHHHPTPSHDSPANPPIGSSVFVWTYGLQESGKRAGITNSCNPGRLSRLKYSNLRQPPSPFLLVHLPTTSRILLCLVAKFHFFVRQTCCARIFFPSLCATTDDVNTRLAEDFYWLLAEKPKH